jgi:malate dehydrogenase (oxaloacetate-decarboxylating)(NADP+)
MATPPARRARPTFTDQEALQFHQQGRPGKIEVLATKPMATQRDLSLAYSPGVAFVNLERVAKIEPYTKDTRLAILTDSSQVPVSRAGYLRLKELMEKG